MLQESYRENANATTRRKRDEAALVLSLSLELSLLLEENLLVDLGSSRRLVSVGLSGSGTVESEGRRGQLIKGAKRRDEMKKVNSRQGSGLSLLPLLLSLSGLSSSEDVLGRSLVGL